MKVRSGQDRENVSRNTIRGGRRESRAGEAWDEIEMGNKTNFWAGKTKSYLHLPALLPEEQEWIMIVGGEWDYSEKRWGDLEERECVNLDPVVMHVGVHQALNPPHVKAVVCAATKVPELPPPTAILLWKSSLTVGNFGGFGVLALWAAGSERLIRNTCAR